MEVSGGGSVEVLTLHLTITYVFSQRPPVTMHGCDNEPRMLPRY